jgi:hypothetical protein
MAPSPEGYGHGTVKTFSRAPRYLNSPKILIMRILSTVLIMFYVLSSPFAQGTVVPDFGNAFDQFSFLEFTQSVAVAEGYAVFNFFQTENELDAMLIIDENGLVQHQVPVETDSTYYEPFMWCN